jgi:hypothetical protein
VGYQKKKWRSSRKPHLVDNVKSAGH